MDDLVRTFLTGQQAFGQRVRAVRNDQWDAPTPDVAWKVADLVGHLVFWQRWIPPLLHGLDPETAARVVDADADAAREGPVPGCVGANYAAAWDDAAAGSAAAFSEDGALDRTVALIRGPTSARAFLTEMIFELVVHTWDLSRAIGYATELPAPLVDSVWTQSCGYGDLSASGMFDSPVRIPDDASRLDHLIAMTGRDPG